MSQNKTVKGGLTISGDNFSLFIFHENRFSPELGTLGTLNPENLRIYFRLRRCFLRKKDHHFNFQVLQILCVSICHNSIKFFTPPCLNTHIQAFHTPTQAENGTDKKRHKLLLASQKKITNSRLYITFPFKKKHEKINNSWTHGINDLNGGFGLGCLVNSKITTKSKTGISWSNLIPDTVSCYISNWKNLISRSTKLVNIHRIHQGSRKNKHSKSPSLSIGEESIKFLGQPTSTMWECAEQNSVFSQVCLQCIQWDCDIYHLQKKRVAFDNNKMVLHPQCCVKWAEGGMSPLITETVPRVSWEHKLKDFYQHNKNWDAAGTIMLKCSPLPILLALIELAICKNYTSANHGIVINYMSSVQETLDLTSRLARPNQILDKACALNKTLCSRSGIITLFLLRKVTSESQKHFTKYSQLQFSNIIIFFPARINSSYITVNFSELKSLIDDLNKHTTEPDNSGEWMEQQRNKE
ncbi:hypothetical protein VP01_344g4 [Puccinia sorghi]|uniref:Uncharacterized protein n=1 Tax=Puccinia sorghi TaxID=27349 RepID=A0A0L6UY28_9BASI|nr:hypothetical protein VP01_344g4 [Puccinia sorghi]